MTSASRSLPVKFSITYGWWLGVTGMQYAPPALPGTTGASIQPFAKNSSTSVPTLREKPRVRPEDHLLGLRPGGAARAPRDRRVAIPFVEVADAEHPLFDAV